MADDAVHSAAQAEKDAAAGDASARERHKQGQRTAQLSKVHRKLEERRAQREGAATPASPETEASSAAAAEIFAAAVETAEKVWVKVAPEDEPFKWKYVARAELLKAQQAIRDLLPGDGDADVLHDLVARLERRIGVNYVQCEENAAGSLALTRALNRLERRLPLLVKELDGKAVPSGNTCVLASVLGATTVLGMGIDVLDACNYKALLTSGWGNPLRAYLHLRKADIVYELVTSCLAKHLPSALHAFAMKPISELSSAHEGSETLAGAVTIVLPGGGGGEPDRELSPRSLVALASRLRSSVVTLQALYTHTAFYHAQVLTPLGLRSLAAQAVERTLLRQLKFQLPFLSDSAAATMVGQLQATGLPSPPPATPDADASEGVELPAHIASNLRMHTAGTGDAEALDALQWARFAMKLSDYYAIRRQYTAAAHCLRAADIILGRETARRAACRGDATQAGQAAAPPPPVGDADVPAPPTPGESAPAASAQGGQAEQEDEEEEDESYLQALALSRMHWGMLHTAVLKHARDARLGAALGQDLVGEDEEEEAEPPLVSAEDLTKLRAASGGAAARGAGLPPVEEAGVEGSLAPEHRDLELPVPDATAGMARLSCLPSVAAVGDLISLEEAEALLEDQAARRASEQDGDAAAPFADLIKSFVLEGGEGPEAAQAARDPHSTAHVDLLLPEQLVDFAMASQVFRLANAALLEAQKFFVLNGFVTDHLAILTAQASCYKYVAMFESDLKRKQAMHSRRLTLLGPMLDVLNPSIYFNLHKEVSLECGHAAADMMDLRRERVTQRLAAARAAGASPVPTAAEAAGVNDLSARAIGFFHHFIRCYSDERLAGHPVPMPPAHAFTAPTLESCLSARAAAAFDSGHYAGTKVEEPLPGFTSIDDESLEAYFTAHFYITRLLQRRVMTSVEGRVADLTGCLERAQWIIKVAPLLVSPDRPDTFAQELDLLKQQVELLPQQLQQLAATKRSVLGM